MRSFGEIMVWAPADQNERYRFEAIALAANILNEELRIEANKRDMPYQSLIKVWLSEDVETHRRV